MFTVNYIQLVLPSPGPEGHLFGFEKSTGASCVPARLRLHQLFLKPGHLDLTAATVEYLADEASVVLKRH